MKVIVVWLEVVEVVVAPSSPHCCVILLCCCTISYIKIALLIKRRGLIGNRCLHTVLNKFHPYTALFKAIFDITVVE